MTALKPTYGWLDFPEYRGWTPGDPVPMPPASSMNVGMAGDRLRWEGRVFTRSGAPMNKVWLEFWHADTSGTYHVRDYKLRGQTFTDSSGRFLVNTVMPGYAGAVRHINYLAAAPVPARKQRMILSAGVFFATEEELDRTVTAEDRPRVHPAARTYRDDPAYLALDSLPVEDGVRRVAYDIVFDVE